MSNKELAERAIACKGWRWLPGMLAERWTGPCHGTYRYSDHDVRAYRWWPRGLPVFDDPATVGCLLALVREARLDPAWLPTCIDAEDEAWVVEPPSRNRQTRHESYAAVLVAALEAADERG